MIVIPNIKKPKTSAKKWTTKPNISFGNFTEENIGRKWKVSSISLKLKEILPFEKNVRLKYDEEEMEVLKQSIQDRSDIGNIDVYHIIKWDKYIISDGHRTHRAYTEVYWDDHKVEVIVRKEVPEKTPEVEIELMEVWFITSNTKKNLWFYEEAYSIKKYLDQLDEMFADKTPHKVSQKNIYEGLGLTKSKAMKYNSLLHKFTLEELSNFEDEEVSYKLLLEISKIEDKETLENVVHVIQNWGIATPKELNMFHEANEELNDEILEKSWEEWYNKEERRKKVLEKMNRKKNWEKEDENLREEYKAVKSIKTAWRKFYKELLNLNVDDLNKEEKDILLESIGNIKRIIQDKKL